MSRVARTGPAQNTQQRYTTRAKVQFSAAEGTKTVELDSKATALARAIMQYGVSVADTKKGRASADDFFRSLVDAKRLTDGEKLILDLFRRKARDARFSVKLDGKEVEFRSAAAERQFNRFYMRVLGSIGGSSPRRHAA